MTVSAPEGISDKQRLLSYLQEKAAGSRGWVKRTQDEISRDLKIVTHDVVKLLWALQKQGLVTFNEKKGGGRHGRTQSALTGIRLTENGMRAEAKPVSRYSGVAIVQYPNIAELEDRVDELRASGRANRLTELGFGNVSSQHVAEMLAGSRPIPANVSNDEAKTLAHEVNAPQGEPVSQNNGAMETTTEPKVEFMSHESGSMNGLKQALKTLVDEAIAMAGMPTSGSAYHRRKEQAGKLASAAAAAKRYLSQPELFERMADPGAETLSITELAARKGVGPIRNADDLHLLGISDAEWEALHASIAEQRAPVEPLFELSDWPQITQLVERDRKIERAAEALIEAGLNEEAEQVMAKIGTGTALEAEVKALVSMLTHDIERRELDEASTPAT